MTDRAREILQYVYESGGSRLYPPPSPTAHDVQWAENPDWCVIAGRLVTWGRKLQPWAARDPRPETIAYAKYQLEDRYWQLYHRTTDEHRKDATSAMHACLHLAFLTLREELEDVQFNAPITVLLPPASGVADAEVIDEETSDAPPPLADVKDAIFGHETDEPVEEEDHDGDPNGR